MDLLQNPFHLLTVSPRDNRRRIMELADERSLLLDSSECIQARSDLTNPRKRLSVEVAWLPGFGPKRVGEVLSLLESSPSDILGVDKLKSIAKTNLLAAGLSRLSDYTPSDLAKWILEMAWAFEDIDPEKLITIINEERVVSGFPEVTDISALEAEIRERRRYYRQVIKSALDKLSAKELVEAVTIAVESATEDGEKHGPIIIDDLVDSYEVEAQGFLEKEEENIRVLVDKLRAAVDAERPDSAIAPIVNQLIQVVENWDNVAQPIQVSAKSRGLGHDASHSVAELVRNLAVYLFNEHGKCNIAEQLTDMLKNVFAEVVEVAERTAEDISALAEASSSQEDWHKEITYEAQWGLLFKHKLSISPEGIEWEGRRWNLDSITRVRWGGVRYNSSTTYTIAFGDDSRLTSVDIKKQDVFEQFTDRLWKAVGVKILTNFLLGLREGERYTYGSTVIDDYGMELEKQSFIPSNERIHCRWNELVIWDEPGSFCVGNKENKKFHAKFFYLNDDNINILEAAIRMFWKRAGDRLSSLLDE